MKDQILQWAKEKGILDKATSASQYQKHVEEVGELGRALIENDIDKVADAIGDIYVTIVILAELKGLDIDECIKGAYNVIAGRTGEMIDGIFVKD